MRMLNMSRYANIILFQLRAEAAWCTHSGLQWLQQPQTGIQRLLEIFERQLLGKQLKKVLKVSESRHT